MTDEFRHMAIHEAGHVVAAYMLGIPLAEVTILEGEDSHGHIRTATSWHRKVSEDDLDQAEYESIRGQFIRPRVRRWVESQVMMWLAGGLTLDQVTGIPNQDTGAVVYFTTKRQLAERGGVAAENREIVAGDVHNAVKLLSKVSSSDEEATAYMGWLDSRVRNMVADELFLAAVEAVVDALMARPRLPGRVALQHADFGRHRAIEAQGGSNAVLARMLRTGK